jgi:hypothetical protein
MDVRALLAEAKALEEWPGRFPEDVAFAGMELLPRFRRALEAVQTELDHGPTAETLAELDAAGWAWHVFARQMRSAISAALEDEVTITGSQ